MVIHANLVSIGFGFLARIYAGKVGEKIDGGGNAEAILLTGEPSTTPMPNDRELRDEGEFIGPSLCGQGLISRMKGKGTSRGNPRGAWQRAFLPWGPDS
jgi:hypothetical protein